MAWKNGFSTPVDKVYNGKCNGIAARDANNAYDFIIKFSWDYPDKVEKWRKHYPPCWRNTDGERTQFWVWPARNDFTKNWIFKKNWDGKDFPRSDYKTFYRGDWYPWGLSAKKPKPKLKRVYCSVRGVNDAGVGPAVTLPYWEFGMPQKPTIDAVSYNTTYGSISTHIRFKKQYKVKNDTSELAWNRLVYKNFGDKKTENTGWITSYNEDTIVDYSPSWSKQLSANERATVVWRAYTRGIAGHSCDNFNDKFIGYVERKYVIAWPSKATIYNAWINSDEVMVRIRVNATENNPVDPENSVKLQYCNDVTTTKASELGGATWHDIDGATDNGNTGGFTIPYQTVKPAVGNQLWFRVETKHMDYVRYSDPYRLAAAYTAPPTATDDACTIFSQTASLDDGKGVLLRIGCKNDGNTGTEIQWTDYSNGWYSTDEPQSFKADWGLANNPYTTPAASSNSTWPKMHNIYVRGLTENTPYWFRARRYLIGDTETHSPWSNTFKCIPVSSPSDVVLTAPDAVPVGSDLTLQWSYNSEAEQKEYKIFNPSNASVTWKSGKDATGVAIISAATINSKVPYTNLELKDASGNNILDSSNKTITTEHLPWQTRTMNLAVSMTTGGNWKQSNTETITIVEPPGIGLVATPDGTYFKRNADGDFVMAKQGGILVVHTTSKNPSVLITIQTDGISTYLPDGTDASQLPGDVVWAGEYTDVAEIDNEDPTLPVEHTVVECILPEGIDLLDGAYYTVYADVVDLTTGLASETVEQRLKVDWSHKAVAPEVSVDVNQEDFNVSVGIWKPEGAESDDVADLYRVTADGAYLIADTLSWGSIVTDRFAPFANGWGETLYYRVATRTPDGDVKWTDDAEYELYGYSLRFDWMEQTLSLPYNVKINDGWSKGFEARKHMDGSYGGYFDSSVKRTATLDTAMIKVSDDEDKRLLRELAQYTGPVFVRTPTGSAYAANVDVTSMQYEFNKPDVEVSIKADEFRLTEEFKVDRGEDVRETGYATRSGYLASLEG